MKWLILLLFSTQLHAVTYHELFCNRIDRQQNQRNIVIKKVDKTLERIRKLISDEKAEDLINRKKFLRYYKNWKYKNDRLKRKSANYIEFAVSRGCPLL